MRGHKLGTVLATNLLWMVFAVSEDMNIEVGPSSRVAAQIGGSTKLTCTVTGCEAPTFSWRTQIDSPLGGKVQNQGTKSTLTMDPVSFENEHSYLCTASCGSKKVERGILVELYSFPRDPEIEMSGPLIVGSPVTVTCKVPKVYPSERLEMAFWKEDSHHPMQLHEIVEDVDGNNVETKGLQMTFTPTMEDMGKSLTCEAKLPIDEMEFEPKERRTIQRLQVNIVPKNTIITITPSNTVQEGDSVTMTCSSEGLPQPQIFWSKKQDDEDPLPLSKNATFTLVGTRKEDSGTYMCEAKNQFGKSKKEVEITVVKPLTVDISPGPKITAQIGDFVVLTCTMMGCEAPFFSWRTQIDSPLWGEVHNEGTKSTLIMNPIGLQNEHFYLCTASCGDKKMEKGVKVELYSFPRDPEIEMSGPLIVGSPATVTCKVPKVYPLDRLEMAFWKEDSHHPMQLHEIVEDADGDNLETKGLQMTFTPTMEDMGKSLTCEAKLPIDEMEFEPKERRTIQRLQVNMPPKDTRLTVFPSDSIKEGDSVTISCTSGDVPKSQIILRKKTEMGDRELESPAGVHFIHAAQLEDAGVYECESKNEGGSEIRSLTLDVKEIPKYFSPQLLALYCLSSLIIPAIGMVIYFARKANHKGSYSLVDALKSKV
ncbi:vascular cell adhesion protein 1 isoform X2 [Dromiciops gliroides]|uniref:vascular cell adhesion protein 1 isoform X2 n=1 Tax=Dromiciops gliroides TaxID=33562 RepID=UPI001CC6504A|nr:vascular cell adhesion protein 1 isoform X2 [Dromiciops gliroides]